MKSGILTFFCLSLLALASEASWHCDLNCKSSVDTVLLQINRHASGTEYGDFNAECASRGGTSTFPGESGCSFVYCKKFTSSTDVVTGQGATVTEARQSARATCAPVSQIGCGLMNFRYEDGYSCKEN